jgi:hypothetical protein
MTSHLLHLFHSTMLLANSINLSILSSIPQLAEIANAPAPPPLGVLAHQTGRGGGAHGAGNASLEEGEEVLEDEDEEDEEALEEEDGEEELLADGQYSETESAFEVRGSPTTTVEPSSLCRVLC